MGQLRKASDFWAGLAGPSRRLLVAAVAIFIVGLFLLMRLSGQVNYVTVATNIPTDQVADIQKQLEAAGIQPKLADSASTIQVPAESLDKARITLATGTAGKTKGMELFDQSGFGDTDQTMAIKFLRAKQGELQRTLQTLEQVQAANVNIAMPEKRVFSEEQKPTTASVVLTLKPGMTLDPEQVAGVTRLVGMAVPNLDPKNVTVTDTKGNILDSAAGTGMSAANNRMDLEAAYERQKQAQIEGMLVGILGPGKAVVTYNANLNLNRSSRESETYDKTSAVPLEQQRTTERLRSTNGRGGGVVGVTPNSPGTSFPAGGATGNGRYTYDRNENNTKNGVNRVRESSEVVPGDVTRQSVGVSLDAGTVTPAMATQIQNQVAQAVSLDTQRGDTIDVARVTFAEDSPVVLAAKGGAEKAPEAAPVGLFGQPGLTTANLIKTGLAVAGVLLILFLALRALRRRQRGLESILPELLQQGPIPIAALTSGDEQPQLEGMTKTPIERQMEDLAMRKPDDMAKLIRGWLSQR